MTYPNAHAARIDSDGIVREVIVIPYCNDDDAEITAYCNGIGLAGTWIDGSYLGARRGRYPGQGYRYDEATDEFVPSGWDYIDGEWQDPTPPEPTE